MAHGVKCKRFACFICFLQNVVGISFKIKLIQKTQRATVTQEKVDAEGIGVGNW